MIWIILGIALSVSGGYQAGKAQVKAQGRDNGGYCMMEQDHSEGCYKVQKTKDPLLSKQIKQKTNE